MTITVENLFICQAVLKLCTECNLSSVFSFSAIVHKQEVWMIVVDTRSLDL